jgi:hypothetical protein
LINSSEGKADLQDERRADFLSQTMQVSICCAEKKKEKPIRLNKM